MPTSAKKRNKREIHASNKPKSDALDPVIQGKLSKAMTTVQSTKAQTHNLHVQWRAHLKRMSFLIGVIALHQCQKAMSECFNNITSKDDTSSAGNLSELIGTSKLVLSGSVCEVMSLAVVIALFKFLTNTNPHGDFSYPSFMASSTLVILSISAYYNSQSNGIEGVSELKDEDSVKSERQFPVAIIFHVIVAVCYWFMEYGMSKCNQSIEMVEDFENELVQTKKVINEKKKTK